MNMRKSRSVDMSSSNVVGQYVGSQREIAIGFVVYNPTLTLLSRLALASHAGFVLYIFDNSPEQSMVRDFCEGLANCKYITCGKNVGLGFGISSVCAQAYYDSWRALIFFDQDTVFAEATLKFVEAFYEKVRDLRGNYSAFVFNDKDLDCGKQVGDEFEFKDILLSINSGSLFMLENVKKLNWYSVKYYVDCVDYEFSLSSNNRGLKIGECTRTPGFDHKMEQDGALYTFFGKELRKYPVNRIMDATRGGMRVWFAAVKTGNVAFSKRMGSIWVKYLFSQLLVRVLDFVKMGKKAGKVSSSKSP